MTHTDTARWQRAEVIEPLTASLESAGLYLAVEVRDGKIVLAGEVDSEAGKQAALDLATAVARQHRLSVDESIDVMDEQIDGDYPTRSERQVPGFGAGEPDSGEDGVEELEPAPGAATLSDVGTVDPDEATEEGIPYFPPTDPPVRPEAGAEQLEMVNGWSPTSVDDFGDADADPDHQARHGDEQLADDIRRELREDALTTDLNVEVLVRNRVVFLRGIVQTLEDAENAEAVAARVPGVDSVLEQLTIPSLGADRRSQRAV